MSDDNVFTPFESVIINLDIYEDKTEKIELVLDSGIWQKKMLIGI